MKTTLKKNWSKGATVLLLALFLIPAVAGAAGPGEGRHDRQFHKKGHQRSALGIWQNPQMLQELGLTDEQVKQIRDADFTFREKQVTLKAELASLRLKMEHAFSEDTVDGAAVLSLATKISELKGQLFIQKIESRLEIRKYLNADQMQKLQLYTMDRKKQGRKHGRGKISGSLALDDPGAKKQL